MAMSPTPPVMHSPVLNAFYPTLIFVLMLTACRATPKAVVTPTTVPPTATAIAAPQSIQSAVTSPEALTVLTGTVTFSLFTIPLPADWHYVRLTDQSKEEALRMVGTANAELLPLVQRFLAGQETQQELLVAWPTEPQVGIGLIGYRLPRHELSLQRYLAAAEQTLDSTPTVMLHEASIRYTIREDVPVGYLHYTLTAPDETETEGHQYLLFDEKATELLLLTFVANVTNKATGITVLVPTPVTVSSASLSAMAAKPPFADIIQAVIR